MIELPGSTSFLFRLAFLNQLFEKKIKIRGGKKRHINFSYFLVRAERFNKLFIEY
ncbi:hypothetical protein BN424_1093 [Carnobacterium maltaromaticum LMA28]|uniref:Uncharacterized protein n=1 Tax=Carnobacterium maltaromaticum LMA28 TaxID=1234679 RepID=K8E2Z5_CARML|nr:hypothetical protein IV70_GL000715 [Carnobacterium maltaromaticum DSM 20342]KRN71620.1 hypothetical protein IV76_GL000652 [Carnobacterium maltaromaticum]CCO10572.1 hypothetical protein BN424_1093 [Carnobacterium maltaromaticum LMA28]